jgi:hypothetical protein
MGLHAQGRSLSVLRNYFPANAATLDAARRQSLAAIPDGQAESDGITVGEAAAAAMIAARANDGSAPPQTFVPDSTDPGVWQPTPPAFGARSYIGQMSSHLASRAPISFVLPPTLTSPRYRRDYDEVKAVGDVNSVRPQDRTDVARFYAAVPPTQAW